MLAEFMDPAILGFILIGVMLFSIFVGFPISFTLIFLGFFFGYLGFGKLVFYLMSVTTFGTAASNPASIASQMHFNAAF